MKYGRVTNCSNPSFKAGVVLQSVASFVRKAGVVGVVQIILEGFHSSQFQFFHLPFIFFGVIFQIHHRAGLWYWTYRTFYLLHEFTKPVHIQ